MLPVVIFQSILIYMTQTLFASYMVFIMALSYRLPDLQFEFKLYMVGVKGELDG